MPKKIDRCECGWGTVVIADTAGEEESPYVIPFAAIESIEEIEVHCGNCGQHYIWYPRTGRIVAKEK